MTEIFVQGFLGRDASVRETGNGNKFLSFSVCSSDFIGGKQKEQWFDCTWFDYNEKLVDYLKKGAGVNVVGALDADIEKTDDGRIFIRRRIITHFVTFSGGGKSKDENNQEEVTQTTQKTTKTAAPPSDEEITVGASKKKFPEEASTNSDLPF